MGRKGYYRGLVFGGFGVRASGVVVVVVDGGRWWWGKDGLGVWKQGGLVKGFSKGRGL